MNIIGIIPARMASTRFPGKPLANILNKPMIQWVWEGSRSSKLLRDVYIATCDQEIIDAAKSFGAPSIMTSKKHERASDRTAEALLKVEELKAQKIDIVVMIQGDEPLVNAEMIDDAVRPLLEDSTLNVVNLMGKISEIDEFEDPNEVKVVVDTQGNALYFSREPIPSRKKGVSDVPMNKQVCIIPFRRDFLLEYNKMTQTPLEIIESVDMMRILENGLKVRMVPTRFETCSVDTIDDLRYVESIMRKS